MLKNSYKMLFIFSLFFGTMMSISSSSWFNMWMGLEINLLSFIPLCMNMNNLFSSEAILKYFLTQALASSLLLFSIILFCFLIEYNFKENLKTMMNLVFCSSLMMKMGMAPFHFWFPIVMEGLNWINNIILMTWQKIAPLIIISFCLNFYFLIFCIILNSIISAFGGLNQISLRKIMAYSSINHLSWMMMAILMNENLWKIYFFFYCFLSISIIYLFNNFKILYINQIYCMKSNKNLSKTILFIPLLSLGGLPPFLGFFPKWLIIELMMNTNMIWINLILICMTLITLYFYIRICYCCFILNHNSMNWNWKTFMNKKTIFFSSIISFFSIFGILIINFSFFLL